MIFAGCPYLCLFWKIFTADQHVMVGSGCFKVMCWLIRMILDAYGACLNVSVLCCFGVECVICCVWKDVLFFKTYDMRLASWPTVWLCVCSVLNRV